MEMASQFGIPVVTFVDTPGAYPGIGAEERGQAQAIAENLEKMFGVKYNEFLGCLHFWIMFVGVNIVFFPQHFLGLQGMPRRYVDYPDAFAFWNLVSSWGYAITAVGVVVFLVMLAEAAIRRRAGVANPWGEGATTLEWTLSSPPPHHQFNELPVVKDDGH